MKLINPITCLILALIVLVACNLESEAAEIEQSVDSDTIWVNIQFNIPEGEVIDDYYYYGRIKIEFYEALLNGEVDDELIMLRDVRYWNDEDGYVEYEDHEYGSNLVFRSNHIVKIIEMKGDPIELNPTDDMPGA